MTDPKLPLPADCTEACFAMPECARCGHRKQPIGRSIPLGAFYCDRDCSGYNEEPKPGHFWPEERDEYRD